MAPGSGANKDYRTALMLVETLRELKLRVSRRPPGDSLDVDE
jgi:hypothetical protein